MTLRRWMTGALAAAAALCVTGQAQAQPYNWGGLYFGVHAGGVWADVDRSYPIDDHFAFAGSSLTHDLSGGAVGVHAGLQHQSGQFVYGIEVAVTSPFEARSNVVGAFVSPVGSDPTSLRAELDWIATATAKLGFSFGQTLLYVKGGYAGAKIGTRDIDSAAHDLSDRRMHHGWTVGVGVDYAITPNILLGVGYDYIDVNAQTHSSPCPPGTCAAPEFQSVRIDPEAIHQVAARLTFKIGRGGPEAAPLK
jgi:outer membrane immunogenic protein